MPKNVLHIISYYLLIMTCTAHLTGDYLISIVTAKILENFIDSFYVSNFNKEYFNGDLIILMPLDLQTSDRSAFIHLLMLRHHTSLNIYHTYIPKFVTFKYPTVYPNIRYDILYVYIQ